MSPASILSSPAFFGLHPEGPEVPAGTMAGERRGLAERFPPSVKVADSDGANKLARTVSGAAGTRRGAR